MIPRRYQSTIRSDGVSIITYENIESLDTTQKTPSVIEFSYSTQPHNSSVHCRKTRKSAKNSQYSDKACKCELF